MQESIGVKTLGPTDRFRARSLVWAMVGIMVAAIVALMAVSGSSVESETRPYVLADNVCHGQVATLGMGCDGLGGPSWPDEPGQGVAQVQFHPRGRQPILVQAVDEISGSRIGIIACQDLDHSKTCTTSVNGPDAFAHGCGRIDLGGTKFDTIHPVFVTPSLVDTICGLTRPATKGTVTVTFLVP